MTSMSTRLFVVSVLVVMLAGSTYVMPQWLRKDIQLPEWDVQDMPMRFGEWQGSQEALDPEIAVRLHADSWVDRRYRNGQNQDVFVHVALFSDLDAGVLHSPINCYRGGGWREVDSARLKLDLPDGSSIPVNLGTWEREGKRVLVMHWYELGDEILFDRWDLGWVRWTMRNQQTWPAMVKVLLQTSADDPDTGKRRIQEVAAYIHQWINRAGEQQGARAAKGKPPSG